MKRGDMVKYPHDVRYLMNSEIQYSLMKRIKVLFLTHSSGILFSTEQHSSQTAAHNVTTTGAKPQIRRRKSRNATTASSSSRKN